MRSLLGPSLVLIFTLSQAFRDVYFGDVFQRYSYFAIILLAFSLSTAIFACTTSVRAPGDFGKLHGHMSAVIAANITTALAWTCFFFALTYLDPAIVNTIHSAMGPLTVVALGAGGVALAKPKPIGRIEAAGYVGIAASVVALWCVVIGGYSGLPVANLKVSVVGLALSHLGPRLFALNPKNTIIPQFFDQFRSIFLHDIQYFPQSMRQSEEIIPAKLHVRRGCNFFLD